MNQLSKQIVKIAKILTAGVPYQDWIECMKAVKSRKETLEQEMEEFKKLQQKIQSQKGEQDVDARIGKAMRMFGGASAFYNSKEYPIFKYSRNELETFLKKATSKKIQELITAVSYPNNERTTAQQLESIINSVN